MAMVAASGRFPRELHVHAFPHLPFDLDALQKGADTFRSLGLITRQLDMKAVLKSDLIPAKDGAP